MIRHAVSLVAALVMTVSLHPLTWAYLEGAPLISTLCQSQVLS